MNKDTKTEKLIARLVRMENSYERLALKRDAMLKKASYRDIWFPTPEREEIQKQIGEICGDLSRTERKLLDLLKSEHRRKGK